MTDFITLPNGDLVTILPLTFARARIVVGPDQNFIDKGY